MARVGRQTKTREYKDLEAHFTANLGYSHHQKAVIVDAPIKAISEVEKATPKDDNYSPSRDDKTTRRIVAYVGGIDLTGIYYASLIN